MSVEKESAERDERPGGDSVVRVVGPDGVPVVYPQVARVLCRIVVRLARMELLAENVGGTEEEEAS